MLYSEDTQLSCLGKIQFSHPVQVAEFSSELRSPSWASEPARQGRVVQSLHDWGARCFCLRQSSPLWLPSPVQSPASLPQISSPAATTSMHTTCCGVHGAQQHKNSQCKGRALIFWASARRLWICICWMWQLSAYCLVLHAPDHMCTIQRNQLITASHNKGRISKDKFITLLWLRLSGG